MKFHLKRLILPLFVGCMLLTVIFVPTFAAEDSSKEKIYVKFARNVEPYHIKSEGGYSGFEIEYAQKIFENSKYNVEVVETVEKDMRENIVYFNYIQSGDRENSFYRPSSAIYTRNYIAFTLKENKVGKLTDLKPDKNYKLGVLQNSYQSDLNLNDNVDVVTYISSMEGINALLNKEIDIWYGDVNVSNYILVKENVVQYVEYRDEWDEKIPVYLYFNTNKNDLEQYINLRIDEIQKQGGFESLFMNYFYRHSTNYISHQAKISNTLKLVISLLVAGIVIGIVIAQIKKLYQKNKYSKSLASSILNYGNRYVILWKSDLSYYEVNSYFKELFDLDSTVMPKDIITVFTGIDSNTYVTSFSEEKLEEIVDKDSIMTSLYDLNGDEREISWSTIIIEKSNNVKTLVSIGSDQTEKNRLRRELQASETRYQLAMQSAEIALIYLCDDGTVPYLSNVGYKILGYKKSDLIDIDSIINKIHQADRKIFENTILKCDYNNGVNAAMCEIRVLCADGEYRWMSFKFKLLVDCDAVDGVNIVGAFFDIDREKKKDIKIERLAYQDELTGIYNRHKFRTIATDIIKTAEETGRRCAVVTFNLDRFHRFNDLYGVDVGDKILKSVANIIRYNPYGKDCSCARLGGDEFACIIWLEQNEDHIEGYVKELSERISDYAAYEYDEMKLTLSAGACIYPDSGINYNDILERAMFSMRIAKSDHIKICQIYNNNIKEIIIKREILEKEIQEAVEKKQFEIYYQPKVNAVTEKIVGAEALIRWNHPKRGVVSPNEFIFVAEEMGIISEIGKWTLKSACEQNAIWQKLGLPKIKIAVNISAIEFYQTDIVGQVKKCLLETGLDSQWLELELTESMALMDIEETINKMNAIRELGVGISIDDFGTGYSSLSNIQNLPIDELKLDKSFIDKMLNDTRTKSIISAIIEMSKIIGLDIVAEGVEEPLQFSLLKEMDCNIIQGYLFSKPLKVEKFVELIKKNYKLGEYQYS